MQKLTKKDLFSLEDYAERRASFREKVILHKRDRRLPLGTNATLYFEDRTTIQYQVQEMLRIERIFEAAGISEELEAYNPLIPDGKNWKATFMVEFPDAEERRGMLTRLVGIENRVWLKVGDREPIRPIADEDLERSDGHKTSAVHFLRFELDDADITGLKDGAELSAGIDHENYTVDVRPVPANVRQSLVADLD
ncbi:MAG: DUF3501 family protein [Woeseia sp.]|nr:DUF3501 family protein [Woeseia sp.]MBT8095534.1 DUF3501 family protein [Woeseia sp.]NNE59858.1 DUF3501 family protein [Woeseia sp.]NNL55859.1 DUF3501 family protein [Woeseia sp.]